MYKHVGKVRKLFGPFMEFFTRQKTRQMRGREPSEKVFFPFGL